MTGLIKLADGERHRRIRPLSFQAQAAPVPVPIDPEIVELRQRVLDLEALLAERDTAAKALSEAADAAFEKGEAAGHEAGREAAEDRSRELLELIGASGERAVAALERRLAATDRLAALLARTCLEKMFGAADSRSDLVCGLLRHRIDELRDEAVVEVRVSAADFESVEAVAGAAPGCRIVVSDALSSGDCTIGLKLGALDIGLGQQWDVLRSALEGMADEVPA